MRQYHETIMFQYFERNLKITGNTVGRFLKTKLTASLNFFTQHHHLQHKSMAVKLFRTRSGANLEKKSLCKII